MVDFNAWRHQRIDPPWWALLNTIFQQAYQQLSRVEKEKAFKLWVHEYWWRFRTGWVPTILIVALAVWLFSLTTSPSKLKTILEITSVLIVIGGALLTGIRSILLGSPAAAKTLIELTSDPMRPILEHFKKMVRLIHKPVAVFIDDLDRCQSVNVVGLLQGIQTLFKASNVTYVIAADREWLRTSLELSYKDFFKEHWESWTAFRLSFSRENFPIIIGSASIVERRSKKLLVYLAQKGVLPRFRRY